MKILCVGEMLADILVTSAPKIIYDNNCSTVGEILVKPGGDAFNNAIDFSRLGHHVSYVGKLSSDAMGQFLLQEGLREGIDMSHVIPSDLPQTKMTILINAAGDRHFLYYPGTGADLRFEDIDLSLLQGCDLLQVSSTFHMPAFDGEGTARLFQAAHQAKVLTSMDITKDFSNRWNEIIAPCYPYLDYFLPSIEQAALVAGSKDEKEIASFFLARGVKHVLVKLGSRGCYYQDTYKAFYCDCYQVAVKETTGAGDAFVAGFMTAILDGKKPEEAALFGTACSAHVIQAVGATSGMPNRSALESFLACHARPAISYVK